MARSQQFLAKRDTFLEQPKRLIMTGAKPAQFSSEVEQTERDVDVVWAKDPASRFQQAAMDGDGRIGVSDLSQAQCKRFVEIEQYRIISIRRSLCSGHRLAEQGDRLLALPLVSGEAAEVAEDLGRGQMVYLLGLAEEGQGPVKVPPCNSGGVLRIE